MNKILLISLLTSLVACSSSNTSPSKEEALRDINLKYQVFERSLNVDIGRTGTDCYLVGNGPGLDIGYRPETDLGTIIAVRAGFLSVKPADKNRWDVSLTDKGNAFVNAEHITPVNHRVGNGCDENQISFPIARAHVSEVAGPQGDAETYKYTYLWKWEVTALGASLRQDGDVYSKLSPSQRKDLPETVNPIHGMSAGPDLPIPVLSEASNIPRSGSAIFKKENNRWSVEVQQ